MKKLIIAGGGTGGHLFPGIAIAEEFKRRFPEADIVFVGTRHGLEKNVIPELGFRLEFVSAKGFKRRFTKAIFVFPYHLLRSFYQSLVLLRKIKPDFVVGTGGYVSGPVVLAAFFKNIPTLIQEQNSYPGVTTRILSLFVDRVCLAYESSKRYFALKKNSWSLVIQ